MPVQRWEEDDFVVASPADGIHRVHVAEGGVLDLFLMGSPLTRTGAVRIPVFFSGAVSRTGHQPGPFFSGHTLAAAGNIPSILVADPTLTDHAELNIGWYLGCEVFDASSAIARVLGKLALRFGLQYLLVGGSAGGFAALALGERLTEHSAVLCWNPQTDVMEYNPDDVQQLVDIAFATHGEPGSNGSRSRHDAVVRDRSTVVGEIDVPREVLYLQNATDWHVNKHAAPYIERLGLSFTGNKAESADRSVVVGFGTWGDGHAIPPREIVHHAVTSMVRGTTASECFVDLESSYRTAFSHRPTPEGYTPRYALEHHSGGIRVRAPGPHPVGTTFAYYVMSGSRRLVVRWYEPDDVFDVNGEQAVGADRVVCFVRDHLGAQRSTSLDLA